MRTIHLLTLLLTTAALPCQGITFLEGPAANDLSVRVVDEFNPTAPGQVILQRVEILPIEITGRTVAQEWDTSRSRRVEVHGMFRVEQPDGGRVFQYRRDGGLWHGFLWVKSDGTAHVVLEMAGVGTAGTDSPFTGKVAVQRDGGYMAVSLLTSELRLVRLDGGIYASTAAFDRPVQTSMPVEMDSVMVGANFVFFQTEDDRIWRCPLVDGGTPFEVGPPAVTGAVYKPEMAMSSDGTTVAFLYGVPRTQSIFLVGEVGTSVQLSPPPSKYEEPGYLPAGPGHEHLLLNDDGTRLLYVDGSVRDELFLLDVSGVLPTFNLTGNATFQPYIGVHILPSFVGTTLLVAIGDPNRMDWFKAEGTGQVSNLTGTGSMQQPYPSGTLDPKQSMMVGQNTILSTELTTNGLELRQVDAATGQSTVLESNLLSDPLAGTSLYSTPDLLVSTPTGDRVYSGSTASVLYGPPAGITLVPPTEGTLGLIRGNQVKLIANWSVPVFLLPNGTVLPGALEQDLKQLVLTQNGAVLHGTTTRYLSFGVNATLPLPSAAIRWVVSGSGG